MAMQPPQCLPGLRSWSHNPTSPDPPPTPRRPRSLCPSRTGLLPALQMCQPRALPSGLCTCSSPCQRCLLHTGIDLSCQLNVTPPEALPCHPSKCGPQPHTIFPQINVIHKHFTICPSAFLCAACPSRVAHSTRESPRFSQHLEEHFLHCGQCVG